MNAKRIQVLTDAENDLIAGRNFYDKHGKTVGDYFWDSLLSDIESLIIFHISTGRNMVFTECYQSDFLTGFIMT
jgi:hypothetical protein